MKNWFTIKMNNKYKKIILFVEKNIKNKIFFFAQTLIDKYDTRINDLIKKFETNEKLKSE